MNNSIFSGVRPILASYFSAAIRVSLGACIAAMLVMLGGPTVAADGAFEVFQAHNESSRRVIRYALLDRLLRKTVYNVGPSHRWMASRVTRKTGTRISTAKLQPSWLEGNRVLFDALNEDQISAVTQYLRLFQELPGHIEFGDLKRDQQLAYWLNLYNLTVYEQIAIRYPVKETKRLRRGSRKKPGLWDEKLLTVMGVSISLNDIQNEILIPIWKSPIVLHGLFQGSIGGPSLRRRAYTGAKVHAMLADNAEEFVNSIRGVHKKGSTARVSLFYDWIGAVFADGENDLRRFLMVFADQETTEILNGTNGLNATYFDWAIADLYNGRKHDGSMYARMYGVGVTSVAMAEAERVFNPLTGGGVPPPGYGNGMVNTSFSTGFGITADDLANTPEARLPPHATKFLSAIRSKFRAYGSPTTRVTIEDIETGDDISESARDNGDGPESEPDAEN